jgi:hypothetical protein
MQCGSEITNDFMLARKPMRRALSLLRELPEARLLCAICLFQTDIWRSACHVR